jgi:hypothetical protein
LIAEATALAAGTAGAVVAATHNIGGGSRVSLGATLELLAAHERVVARPMMATGSRGP